MLHKLVKKEVNAIVLGKLFLKIKNFFFIFSMSCVYSDDKYSCNSCYSEFMKHIYNV